MPVADVQGLARLPAEPDPAELLERSASRDWIWAALEELSPTLRLPAMLRYFTDVTAYEQIAALCEVPIGTVRSRLSQARRKLAEALLATADAPYDDAAALTEAQRIQGEEVLRSARRGTFAEALAELWSPTVELTWPSGRRTQGFDYLVGAMERDLSDGVRQTLVNVVASREVVIWESDLVSPPEDPFHCPPSVVWVQLLEAGRVQRVRFFHPRRDAGVMTAVAS